MATKGVSPEAWALFYAVAFLFVTAVFAFGIVVVALLL